MRISSTRKGRGCVADMTLTPKPPLGGLDRSWGETRLRELTELAFVAVSIPQGGEDALGTVMQKAYGCAVPPEGRSHAAKDGVRVIGYTADQVLIAWDHVPHSGVAHVADKLGDAGYYVEQTSNFVTLELDGPLARDALARLTALNLADAAFPEGAAQRTVMEHMGATVVRVGPDAFWLIGASSMARSFAHAIETSLDWVS